MFSGPRVYAKGPGYEWVKAIYVIQDVRVEVRYMVTSYGMAQIDPWVLVSSVSGARHSYNVLSYYDLDVVGYADDMITRVSDGLIYQTEAKLRNVEVTVRDFSHNTPRVRLLPYGGDNPDEWLLHCCQFYSSDPDLYLNGDSIYRQDIVAYYRATYGLTTAALTGPWLFVEY